jgi:hypothetical protein
VPGEAERVSDPRAASANDLLPGASVIAPVVQAIAPGARAVSAAVRIAREVAIFLANLPARAAAAGVDSEAGAEGTAGVVPVPAPREAPPALVVLGAVEGGGKGYDLEN